MEKKKLLELLDTDFKKAYERIQTFQKVTDYDELKDQYDCTRHAITKRENKWIDIPDPFAPEGEERTIKFEVVTAKLPISDQEIIVSRAAAFLCGNPIKLDCHAQTQTEKDLLAVMQKTSDDNKMDYEDKNLCEILFSEKEVAELWYPEEVDAEYWKGTPSEGKKFRLRFRVLSNSNNDTLYPVFNKIGDMVAFGRGYSLKNDDGEEEQHFDLYTDEKFYFYTLSKAGEWGEPNVVANILEKIPVIYHYKPKTEFQNVQPLISRREFSISHHSDINDYNGAPTRFVTGKILGWSKKAEAGAVIEGTPGSDIKILSWDHAPESIKLEQDNLRSLIYDETDTPDISFSQMKGLLGNVPQIGIKLLFSAAHLKASKNEGIYGKGVQRRINLWKAAMIKINVGLAPASTLNVKPKFEYYLPKNESEAINLLATAVSADIISNETATKISGLVENGEQEWEIVKKQKEAGQQAAGLDSLMNQ